MDLISILGGIILRGLGERLNGIQEVMGSIPTISTKQTRPAFMVGLVCFFASNLLHLTFFAFCYTIISHIYNKKDVF